jgi:hypothetical protein
MTVALLSPQSTALVSTPTPTLRFRLSGGLSSAKVEVCADRGCRVVRWSSDVSTPVARVAAKLPPGPAFWHVRAHDADGGEVSSPTWVFRVGHRKAVVDTSWLMGWDVNGDGIDDLPLPLGWFGAFVYGDTTPARAVVQTSALEGAPCSSEKPRASCVGLGYLLGAGDVDGDGFADALSRVAADGSLSGPNGSEEVHIAPHVLLFRGRESGSPEPMDSAVCPDMRTAVALGDTDGDGFADVAVQCGETWQMYRGSERGLVAASGALRPPILSALDVNADGLPDVLTGDGLRLGATSGLGAPLDVAPMPVADVVGAVARADGVVDFVARQGRQFTVWHAAPGEASRAERRLSSRFLSGQSEESEEPVVPVGDVDGDGFDDIAVGKPAQGGWVQVLPGGPRAPRESLLKLADRVVDFGWPVTVGDFNGDGYDDLLVRYIDDVDIGMNAYLYLGGPHGLASQPAAGWSAPSQP